MISPINIRGFQGRDPLDQLPPKRRLLLAIGVTAVVTIGLVILITRIWPVIQFRSVWVEVGEVVLFAFVFAPIMLGFRKSSSLVHYLLVFLPFFLFDLYLQSHVREAGKIALWMYTPGTLIDFDPPALRFLLALSFDAIIVGPLCLWLARLSAPLLRPAGAAAPVREPLPFPARWTEEQVPRPPRDVGYWILRLIGLMYFGYLTLLLIGGLGTTGWPAQLRDLFEVTWYGNPVLAAHTVGKIVLMGSIAFVGAFNRRMRFTCTLVLLIAHATSVAATLYFYLVNPVGAPVRDMLLASTIVDGVFVLAFLWTLRASAGERARGEEAAALPGVFSLPAALWRYTVIGVGVGAVLGLALILAVRLCSVFAQSWGAMFTAPDPGLGNALTLYAALAALAFLMAGSQAVRDHLTSVMTASLLAVALMALVLLAVGELTLTGSPTVSLRGPTSVFLILFAAAATALVTVRRLYFNSEYSITTFGTPSAQAILGMQEALYPDDPSTGTLQALDRYAGTIHGRKRGLINFPFWLVEKLFPVMGLRPAFSAMSAPERKYFLRRFLIRREDERNRSMLPEVAGLAYTLGLASQSLVIFGAYAGLARRSHIGYVAPGARDRMQSETPSGPPPFAAIADLPSGRKDPANWPPGAPAAPNPPPPWTPAPRVTTPTRAASVPKEADYVIVGSGPGGAVAAYRLASECEGSVLLVERGARFSPRLDFNDGELDMIAKLYKEGGVQQTKRADFSVLQGEAVGGTSVVNNAVCFRMPDAVREDWDRTYGLALPGLEGAYDRIASEIDIVPLPAAGINQHVQTAFRTATAAVSTVGPPEVVQVNGPGAKGDGLWNLGNRQFGKRTMLETYVPWAEKHGAEVAAQTTAVSFAGSGGKVDTLLVRTVTGELERVRVKKALVLAGGVIASSHLLIRSGVAGRVGQRMSCNFAFPMAFETDRVIDAFDGEQITMSALDTRHAVIYETYFNPPGALALTVPFFFDRHTRIMEGYRSLLSFGALVGSEPNGRIERRADLLNGRAFTWSLGAADQTNIKAALTTLVRLGQASGAKRAILPTRPGASLELTDTEVTELERVLGSRDLRLSDLLINTAHPQGGNMMAGPGRPDRVVDESFRVVGYDNLYVVDASIFPTSITVNPQWTIMALSSLASERICRGKGES